jgi:inorganic pyrophosphatase
MAVGAALTARLANRCFMAGRIKRRGTRSQTMKKKAINATHYELIPSRPNGRKSADHVVNAIIETCKDSPHKYALKNDYGIIAFKEVLPAGMRWPYDYGFVPGTLADDGDPIDVLVLSDEPLFSGCLIQTRVIGNVRLSKNGVENDRLIAVPQPSAGAPKPTDAYTEISDLPESQLDEIIDFLRSYSEREGNRIDLHTVVGAAEAQRAIKQSMKAFEKTH